LSTINPNDVESVTILKDAAAAAIWGAKSGNGVIVITTKKGRLAERTKVELNSNITLVDKPNLFYRPQLTSSEYIGLQEFLFEKGYYAGSLRNDYSYIPEAVVIFQKRSMGEISQQEAQMWLDELAHHDVRDELNKYFYRKDFNQQYAVNISGGTEKTSFFISGGYDNNRLNLRPNSSDRKSINSTITTKWLDDRLELSAGITYTNTVNRSSAHNYSPLSPYDRLVDQEGNAMALPSSTLRVEYADTAGRGRLLDWSYKPVEEIERHNTHGNINMLRTNLTLSYRPIPQLQIAAMYQYL